MATSIASPAASEYQPEASYNTEAKSKFEKAKSFLSDTAGKISKFVKKAWPTIGPAVTGVGLFILGGLLLKSAALILPTGVGVIFYPPLVIFGVVFLFLGALFTFVGALNLVFKAIDLTKTF